QNVKNDLENLLSTVQSKNKQLDKDLEREQQWYNEQEQLLDALNRIEEKTKMQIARFASKSATILDELQGKIVKVRVLKDELSNVLGGLLSEHFPLPEKDGSSKRKMEPSENPKEELITLHEILEILIRKSVETPHEPYVMVSNSFWPPYIELLLRYGIVLRHPDDVNRLRLEPFHM
ncbi:CENPK protein, partial [Centropus unirufus]|nr:CENPK protein [Centropus unirufus]